MARRSAQERIEDLVRQPADFPFDGYIVEIRPGFVSMKMIGTNRIKRNVAIPDHIHESDLSKGMPARILDHQNQPVLVEVFKNFSELPNYAGKGSVIPNPPRPSVVAGPSGWELSWPVVAGADKYQVYRNDAPNPNSPDDLGIVFGLSMLVPYELSYRWFAVRAISGLQVSELSGWVTDSDPPATPNTFSAEDGLYTHRLIISGTDVSLNHYGFKYWEVEVADSALGQNNTSLGYFGMADFPKIIDKAAGVTNWYRIRALDYADNPSPWSEWDSATAIGTTVEQGNEIEDRFDAYGGTYFSSLGSLNWLQIANATEKISGSEPLNFSKTFWEVVFDNSYEKLTGANAVHGDVTLKVKTPSDPGDYPMALYLNFHQKDGAMPLGTESRFTSSDYFMAYLYMSQELFSLCQSSPTADDVLRIVFTVSVQDEFGGFLVYETATHEFDIVSDLAVGYNRVMIKKSDFTLSSGFDWGDVNYISINCPRYFTSAPAETVYFLIDDLRFVKADPVNPDTWNDTGGVWQFTGSNEAEAGVWHVLPGMIAGEPNKPFSLGQIDTRGDAKHLLAWRDGNIDTGTVQAGVYFKDDWGNGGIAFFVNDATPNNWTFYGVRASTDNTVELEKWVNGTRDVLGVASLAIDRDQVVWLGVDLREYSSNSGLVKVYATTQEGNVIQASNLVLSVQDTSIAAGGGVGLMTRDKNTRFVNLIAGSPAHAVVSDVSLALDGPIMAGYKKRVRFNPLIDWFEVSEDGVNWTNLVPPT